VSRHCYLTPHQLRRLDAACAPIVAAYGPFTTYLVGSVLSRPDYRDVDVRTIIADSQFDSREWLGLRRWAYYKALHAHVTSFTRRRTS